MAFEYTKEEKGRAILLLEANIYNISRTAKQTGIDRKSLRRWVAELGGIDEKKRFELQKKNEAAYNAVKVRNEAVEDAIIPIDCTQLMAPEDEEASRRVLAHKILELKGLLVKRIEKTSKDSTDIDAMARALKVLNDIELSQASGYVTPENHTTNFIAILKQKIETNNY